MDELRSTPFSAGLRRLLAEALQDGERVLWQAQPDAVAHMMMWRFLWWIGCPWLVVAAVATAAGWIEQSAVPLLMLGGAMVAAPAVILLHDLQTLFAVTSRRALILRTAWGRRTVGATSYQAMDAALETIDIGGGAGHLNFASGRSTRSPDADYTGRYGFRCVRDVSRVRDILERARQRKVNAAVAGIAPHEK